MRWDITLERTTRNRLNPDITRKNLRKIAEAASRNKSLGFEGRVGKLGEPQLTVDPETRDEVHRYLVRLRLEKAVVRSEAAAREQYEHVLRQVTRTAESRGWKVLAEPATAAVARAADVSRGDQLAAVVNPPRPRFVVPTLTDAVMASEFAGIYDRESHIRVIHDSVTNYFESRAMHDQDPAVEIARSHVLLKGKPAGCKTTVFDRFKKWYERGSDVERVKFVDAHTMTKAGLENALLDMAEAGELPEIIVLEEIEKQNPDNLLSLISVMGSGYVSKLNARVGHRKSVANVLIWATCNDERIIRNFRAGVLWSRFIHKLHCTRPSRELMERILLDKVAKMGGNPAWVTKAMEFAFDLLPQALGRPMDDPREVKGLLDGKDRLLDGSYQLDLLAILKAEAEEAKADSEQTAA